MILSIIGLTEIWVVVWLWLTPVRGRQRAVDAGNRKKKKLTVVFERYGPLERLLLLIFFFKIQILIVYITVKNMRKICSVANICLAQKKKIKRDGKTR